MGHLVSEDQHLFLGVHVFGELYGVCSEKLNDLALLESLLIEGIKQSGASLCDLQKKQFTPNGVTILALLSESHASLHTYPEQNALFYDAFTCGTTCRPEKIVEVLVAGLKPEEQKSQKIIRGHTASLSEEQYRHVSSFEPLSMM